MFSLGGPLLFVLSVVELVELLVFGFASFVGVGSVEILSIPVPVALSAIDRPCMSRSLASVIWICLLPYSRETCC
jgi:hypothetical protein